MKEKFGVKPRALPDLFGLVGDVADNIPGESPENVAAAPHVMLPSIDFGHLGTQSERLME